MGKRQWHGWAIGLTLVLLAGLMGHSIYQRYTKQQHVVATSTAKRTIPAQLLSQQKLQYRTHRKLQNMQAKLGTLQKVVPNDRHITYRLTKHTRVYDELIDREKTSSLNNAAYVPYDTHNERYNFMAVRTYYGSKQTLVGVRIYDLYNTFKPWQAPGFYQLETNDFDEPAIIGYVRPQDLKEVQPIRSEHRLNHVPYYLNTFDGEHGPNDYKMTTMRVWNVIPGSKPNVTGDDVSHLLYQQLYATKEATNNQGRTYLYLRNATGPVGWIRKSHQLTRGKFVNPAKALLHAKTTDTVRLQTQPVKNQHGYHYAQRVYNLYRHHHWICSLTMSYLYYPTVFDIHGDKVTAVRFYDHHYRLIQQAHDGHGLKKVIETHPKAHTLDWDNDNARVVDFNLKHKSKHYLFSIQDGDPDPEDTYGTIYVNRHGHALMWSSGMASLE